MGAVGLRESPKSTPAEAELVVRNTKDKQILNQTKEAILARRYLNDRKILSLGRFGARSSSTLGVVQGDWWIWGGV